MRRRKSVAAMRYQVLYQEQTKVSDGAGGFVVRWKDFFEAPCEFEQLSLSQRARYGQLQVDVTHKLVHRFIPGLKAQGMRAMMVTHASAEPIVLDVITVDDIDNRQEYNTVLALENGIDQTPPVAREY